MLKGGSVAIYKYNRLNLGETSGTMNSGKAAGYFGFELKGIQGDQLFSLSKNGQIKSII